MSHDQLSKSLISTFFPDFLHLVAPDAALRLRPGEATFLDKELFLDWPDLGRRREVDLLARVPVEEPDGPPVLVHVEIEARAGSGMSQRLWRYFMQIRLRFDLLVLTVLVNLRGGRPGVGLEVLQEGLDATAPVVFPYRVLSLSGCLADDWLSRKEPIAWAFAALMRSKRWSRAELKIECLRRVARSEVAGIEREVLVNWLKTCVKLTAGNAAEYERLLALEENKEIRHMETTWLGKAEARGMKKGLAQGKAEGKAEGKSEAVGLMKQALLQGLERRFGAVPEKLERRLDAIQSVDRLAELVTRALVAPSLDELLVN
ncbi:MAG TPA: hypothetical protein DD490_22055 [Acidobacteria bacterium]|nr:hypothetical protein [Acidobacteriota bacterium]